MHSMTGLRLDRVMSIYCTLQGMMLELVNPSEIITGSLPSCGGLTLLTKANRSVIKLVRDS